MEDPAEVDDSNQEAKTNRNEKAELWCSALELSEDVKKVVQDGFSDASQEEIGTTLDMLIPQLLDKINSPDSLEHAPIIVGVLSFLKTLADWRDYGKRRFVRDLFKFIGINLTNEEINSTWKNHMVQLSTKFVQTTHYNEHCLIGTSLLKHLLSIALPEDDRQITVADIKRIKDLKNFILSIDLLEPTMNPIVQYFMKAIVSKNFLKCREGIIVLAYFLSKEESLVKNVQIKIREHLGTKTKSQAASYGNIYFHAWLLSEGTEVRKEIEQQCMQDIMNRAMTLKRNGVVMGKMGSLTFSILRAMGSHRRLTKFSRTITELYQPILWRSLKSHNPLERCNAAQIFFDAFPLEKVGVGAAESCRFKDMQVKEMIDLLTDECHLVRIVSIKGMVNVLKCSLDLLSVTDIKLLMALLSEKLGRDGSCYKVRVAVFNTFRALIGNNSTRSIVFPILKTMRFSFHDENEKVRKALVDILLTLDQLNDPEYRYWAIVPLKHIIYRLKTEGPAVGSMLAQLIMPHLYKTGQLVSVTIKNTNKIINISDLALMNIFQYSKKSLSIDDAFAILVSIVGTLKKELKNKSTSTENESDSPKKQVNKKARESPTTTLTNITNKSNEPDESNNEESTEVKNDDVLDNHKLVSGLLLSACVLWATHNTEIAKQPQYQRLSQLTASSIAPLLLYYKGTKVYYNVISLATFVPIQMLTPVSTVASACISELRQMNETCDPEIINCLVIALCLWNRTQCLLDLAREWLNQAFSHQNLNSSMLPKRPRKRVPKVRFEQVKGKPQFAVKLLENLFMQVICEKKVVEKNYSEACDLFNFMRRIQDLIQLRIENGKPWEECDLSDEFLENCLSIYLKMMLILHRPDVPPDNVSFSSEASSHLPAISAAASSVEMINWANRVLFQVLNDSESPQLKLAVRCYNLVMNNAVLAINLNYTSQEHSLLVHSVLCKLMNTESALQFMDVSLKAMQAAWEYTKAYNKKDEWSIVSVHTPQLVRSCLNVFCCSVDDESAYKQITDNFQKFKVNLFYPLIGAHLMYGGQHRLLLELCNDYLGTVIALIGKEVSSNESIDIYYKLSDHPFLSVLIIKYFLSKTHLAAMVVPWIQSHADKNKEDPITVISAISLLSTLALSCRSRLQVPHIEQCFSQLYTIVTAFDDEQLSAKGVEIITEVCCETGCSLLNIGDPI